MKLLYLYMTEVGPIEGGLLRSCDFNFDSNWQFSYAGHEETGIQIRYNERLPRDFFGNSSVNSVSVVVGMNGTGKTSLASSLAHVLRYDSEFKRQGYRGRHKQYVAVMQEGAQLTIYTNSVSIRFDESLNDSLPDFAKKAVVNFNKQASTGKDFKFLGQDVRFFYYSPVVTTERVMFGSNKEGVVYDLSSTTMLDCCGTWSKYQAKERKSVLAFLRAANIRQVDVKDQLGMGVPKKFYLCWEVGNSAEVAVQLLPSMFSPDDKFQRCRKLLEARDRIALSLVAFVAKNVPVKGMLPNMEEEEVAGRKYHDWGWRIVDAVLDMYKELGWGVSSEAEFSFEHAVRKKEQRIHAYREFCRTIRDVVVEIKCFEQSEDNELVSFVSEVADEGWGENAASRGLAFYESLWGLAERNDVVLDEYGIKVPFESKDCIDVAFGLLEDVASFETMGRWKVDFDPVISSGEMAYCSMFARMYDNLPKSGNVLLFMDEAETTLHPDHQTHLVERIIRFLDTFFPELRVHVIFATHSPILLSDVPGGNVIFLEKLRDGASRVVDGGSSPRAETFAANIFDLYRDSFFMHDGTVGAFARLKLDALMKKISCIIQGNKSDKLSAEEWKVAELVGDPQAQRYFEGVKPLVENAQGERLT